MAENNFFKKNFGVLKDKIAENVILTPFLPLTLFRPYINTAEFVQTTILSLLFTEKIAVLRTGMGANIVGDATMLLKGSRCRNIFFVGSCGGLNNSSLGDLLLVEKAYPGEGFSQYYRADFEKSIEFKSEYYCHPEKNLQTSTEAFLKNNSIDYKKASIYTTGSLFSETETLINKLSENNFGGIELEVSAFYTAAKEAGLNALALLFVTDIPFKKPLDGNFSEEDNSRVRLSRNNIIQTAMKLSGIEVE